MPVHALQALAALRDQDMLHGKSLVDFNAGSGILGLAALAMGASEVVATESHAQSLLEALTNAQLNGYDIERFQVRGLHHASQSTPWYHFQLHDCWSVRALLKRQIGLKVRLSCALSGVLVVWLCAWL